MKRFFRILSLGVVATCVAATSFANGEDVTATYLKNADMEQGVKYWSIDGGIHLFSKTTKNVTHHLGYHGVNNMVLENWNARVEGLEDNSISQTIKNLPSGTYVFGAYIGASLQNSKQLLEGNAYTYWSNRDSIYGVSLYANEATIPVATDNPDFGSAVVGMKWAHTAKFNVATVVTDGKLEVGIKIENTNANFVIWDNATLYYFGDMEPATALDEMARIDMATTIAIADTCLVHKMNVDTLAYLNEVIAIASEAGAEGAYQAGEDLYWGIRLANRSIVDYQRLNKKIVALDELVKSKDDWFYTGTLKATQSTITETQALYDEAVLNRAEIDETINNLTLSKALLQFDSLEIAAEELAVFLSENATKFGQNEGEYSIAWRDSLQRLSARVTEALATNWKVDVVNSVVTAVRAEAAIEDIELIKVIAESIQACVENPNGSVGDFQPTTMTGNPALGEEEGGAYVYKSELMPSASRVESIKITFLDAYCPNGSNKGNPPFVAISELYVYDETGAAIDLTADCFASNASDEAEGRDFGALCDENPATFWHSDWHGRVTDNHYLEVTIPNGVNLNSFYIGWRTRNANQNIPASVEVTVTASDEEYNSSKGALSTEVKRAEAFLDGHLFGTGVGYYDADPTILEQTIEDAIALLAQDGVADEGYDAQTKKIIVALEALAEVGINLPVAGKSYRIVSALDAFFQKQGVHKAIYANVDTVLWATDGYGNEISATPLWWGDVDVEKISQEFIFEPVENEESTPLYLVKNVATGLYVSHIGVPYSFLGDIPDTVKLVPLGNGEFNLISLENGVEETSNAWHAGDHNQGVLSDRIGNHGGILGDDSGIVGWSGGLNTPSSWYICEFSEMPMTVWVDEVEFRSNTIHLYSGVNAVTLTVDGVCAFDGLQVYDRLGNVLPANIFVSNNTATIQLESNIASFAFGFNNVEGVASVVVNASISRLSALREAYDAAVAIAPVKGTGMMQYADLDEYEAALANAERLLVTNAMDEEVEAAITQLDLAVANLVPNMPDPNRMYFITSAFNAFVEHHGVNMMIYDDGGGTAKWMYENTSNLNRCWQFESANGEEGYYLKNVATGMYLGYAEWQSQTLSMVASKDETVPYVISPLGGDTVAIAANTNDAFRLHAMNHKSGAGKSGTICYWNAGVGSASSWRICDAEVYGLDALTYEMHVQDVETTSASMVNIPIELTNSTVVTAFQFDLYMPDIAVVYDVLLNGERATASHMVASSVQADGALRVIVYSTEDKPFIGNDGVIVEVVAAVDSAATEGNYPLILRNVRMVKAGVTEVLGADYTATLTVTKGSLIGDVNSDGIHTMADVVMLVNAVLGKEQTNFDNSVADVNGDGIITMADVVGVIRFVLGYEPVVAVRCMAREASAVAIETGNVVAGSNGEIILPVYMNSKAAYTAFQMDVVLPEGMLLTNAALGACAKSSHSIAWSVLDNGAVRIVAYAMDNATFKNTAESLLHLTLKSAAAVADDAVVTLTNGLFATVTGAEDRSADVVWRAEDETTGIDALSGGFSINGAAGAVVVESVADATISIYSMTGQLVQQARLKAGRNSIALPIGMYVINKQKVIVK